MLPFWVMAQTRDRDGNCPDQSYCDNRRYDVSLAPNRHGSLFKLHIDRDLTQGRQSSFLLAEARHHGDKIASCWNGEIHEESHFELEAVCSASTTVATDPSEFTRYGSPKSQYCSLIDGLPFVSSERKRLKIPTALRRNAIKPEELSQLAINPSASTALRRKTSSTSIGQKYLEEQDTDPSTEQDTDPSTEHDSDGTDASTPTGGKQQNNSSGRDGRARLKRKRDDIQDSDRPTEYENITHELEKKLRDQRRSLERREQWLDEKEKRLETLEDNLLELEAKLIQAEEETISEAERTLARLEEDFSCSL